MKKILYILDDGKRSFTYSRIAGFCEAIRGSEEPINMYIFRSAGFAEYELLLGEWRLNAGLRYEHVKTDYTSFGVWQEEPSRTYNDWFPNLSATWHRPS